MERRRVQVIFHHLDHQVRRMISRRRYRISGGNKNA
jgi:hypothetical protein